PQLAKDLLEKNGFQVELKTGLPTNMARKALLAGEVDLYYEYTGTGYTVFYKQKDPAIMNDPQAVYNWMKKKDAEKGLDWLPPVKLNNTYTLMMKKPEAEKLGISSISDLAVYVKKNPDKLIVGIGTEFWNRPDGFKKLAQDYGLKVPIDNIKKMSLGLAYQALKDGQIDVGMGFATDGRIAAFNFVNLKDDKKFFPVYNPAPVVRKKVLDKYPEIKQILEPLAKNLDTADMQNMNKAVDVEHQSEADVAKAWLKEKGL
ncbi:MAG: glycine betaine ABC transporter substrate-binding protein, partial [Desulfobacteraceae bacterium]